MKSHISQLFALSSISTKFEAFAVEVISNLKMNSKVQKMMLAMCFTTFMINLAESTLFTAAGLIIDGTLAFVFFNYFLAFFLPLFGKRSVDDQAVTSRSEEYLRMAFSMDGDKCLPVAVCAAMARSRNVETPLNRFEDLLVRTFERKLQEEPISPEGDSLSPLAFYLNAAKFGRSLGYADACPQISPSCKYSVADIRKLTSIISKLDN